MDFYNNIKAIKYEGAASDNPLTFKFYNAAELIGGKSMKAHLKYALSFWHTVCGEGADMFGAPGIDKSFGGKTAQEISERRIYAAFEIMRKLDIDYFCFHDKDIAEEGETLSGFFKNTAASAAIINKCSKEEGRKLLWGTANLFSNPRYACGAATGASADVFCAAAAQVKNMLDITVDLGGAGFVFWGGREGYESLINTDMGLELDNMARLLRAAVDYGRRIGFKGDFYIEPKPKEPMKHQYDFDAATVAGFLRKYGLDKDFKLNIEANHATLAGHTFAHELATARINGMFGSIDANQGDLLLGWDTDEFPVNVYETAFAMLEVLRAGGFKNGGLNFDAKSRRTSTAKEDVFHAYIAGMDAFALGLRIANKIVEDGRIDEFIKSKYSSYNSGIGKEIIEGASLERLAGYALSKDVIAPPDSGNTEYLNSIINSIMFRNW